MGKDRKDGLKVRIGGYKSNSKPPEQPKVNYQAPEPPRPEKEAYEYRQAPLFDSGMTEVEVRERIEKLNEKDSNLVFMFGDIGSSKTTVLAATSTYLSHNYLTYESIENKEGNRYTAQIQEYIRDGRFPPVTSPGKFFEYDIAVRKSKSDDWLNLTFIEMSGEYSKQAGNRYGAGLSKELKIYLTENELPILVLIIVGYDELTNRFGNSKIDYQDALIKDFLNYLHGEGVECENIGIIVSKYDKNKVGNLPLSKAVESLTATMMQIQNISEDYRVFPFSVGEVEENGWADGEARIRRIDLSDCGPIVDWIVETMTPPKEEVNKPKWKFW